MDSFPLEVSENILLHLPLEELSRICSISSEYYSLCSSRAFWVKKFKEDNLPLLLSGDNFNQWLEIYKQTLDSKKFARATMETLRDKVVVFYLTLYHYEPPIMFTAGTLDEERVKNILIRSQRERMKTLTTEVFRSDNFFLKALSSKLNLGTCKEYPVIEVQARVQKRKIVYNFGPEEVILTFREFEELLLKLFFFALSVENLFPFSS